MSKIISKLSIIALLVVPVIAFAQNGTGQGGQGIQQQGRVQDPATHQEGDSPVGNQYQNVIQNQGETPQIRAQEQEGTAEGGAGIGSSMARQRMSAVGQKINDLVNAPGFQGAIGSQVKEVAQAQQQSQNRVLSELNRLENRNEFVKRLLGPNYEAIDSIKGQVAQNQQRIQTLHELSTEVQNEADQKMLQETIQAMIDQNTALQLQVQEEEDVSSLFGWLMKFLSM